MLAPVGKPNCYRSRGVRGAPGGVSLSLGESLGVRGALGGAVVSRLPKRSVSRGCVLVWQGIYLHVDGVSPRPPLGVLVDAECSVQDGMYDRVSFITIGGRAISIGDDLIYTC